MADRKHDEDDAHTRQPPRHANNPDQPPGQAGKPQPRDPRDIDRENAQPRNQPPDQPPPGQSQKSQISQYFKSQGRQPDDVIFELGGMRLLLKDLD